MMINLREIGTCESSEGETKPADGQHPGQSGAVFKAH